MNYKKTIDYLYSLYGVKLSLNRIKSLLKKLGNPEKALKMIHVAGTNGKGSVCAMLNSVLTKAGFKTGMFTSPHLVDIRERFLINNKKISKKDFFVLFKKIRPYIKNNTFFEVITAMAFVYFKEKKVDFAIIEVGLGGRLDSTNAARALISVITNVSLEHQNYLGKTIEKITYEKAGIIKKNNLVITGCKGKALQVVKKVCKEKKAKLFLAEKSNFKTNLLGDFQLENANTAVKVIEVLKKNYLKLNKNKFKKINKKLIKKALMSVKWPGRLEIIKKNPLVIIDGAHNPACFKAITNFFKKNYKNKKLVLIAGFSQDKDYKKMLTAIRPLVKSLIITKSEFKSEDIKEIFSYAKKCFKYVLMMKDLKKALKYGLKTAKKQDIILVAGSLYVVGEVRIIKNELP